MTMQTNQASKIDNCNNCPIECSDDEETECKTVETKEDFDLCSFPKEMCTPETC